MPARSSDCCGGREARGGGGGLPSLRPHHPPPGSAARLLCTLAPALSAGRAAAPRAQHGGESRFAAAAAGRAAGCPGGRGLLRAGLALVPGAGLGGR